jgi:beta-glucosidase
VSPPAQASAKAPGSVSSTDFLWGVATSAYQHEGGYNGPGEPLNNWALAEKNHRVAVSGRSANFWNLAQEDFARCEALGLNAFRLGLSWARIQPVRAYEATNQVPEFDYEALAHYAGMIAQCRRAGMEPIVTLHHFTHPLWLGVDAWLNTETITHFLRFVQETVTYLLTVLPRDHDCAPPLYYITVNEPNMLASCTYVIGAFPSDGPRGLPSFTTCLGHLLEAHVRAYHLVHALYAPTPHTPKVSFNNYCSDLYWNDQAWLDLLFARQNRVPRAHLFRHLWERAWAFDREFQEADLPIKPWQRRLAGNALKKAQHFMAYACSFDTAWVRLVDLLYQTRKVPLDYLAIDYYDPFAAHALRWPTLYDQFDHTRDLHELFIDSVTTKWWDWHLLPEGLTFFVRSLQRFKLPILIAENGMAHRCPSDSSCQVRRDRVIRSDYIKQHVKTVVQLTDEGHPLFGYLYWSLMDNYEWGTYSARFGLYSIDFSTSLDRRAADPSGDNAALAYAAAIHEARHGTRPSASSSL